VACGSQALEFAAFGLKPKKKHLLGFSWWDFEGAKRVQHVQVEGASPTNAQLLVPPTLLPSFEGRQQGPVSMVLPLAPDACVSGKLRICVVKDQGTNAVLSELWLIESDSGMVGPSPEKPPQARILLVTGNDYPGHAWRQTAPALAEQIRQDKRLQVSVVEDPEFLANPAVFGFDAMVMHWMNWESPSPGPTARENLSQYVASGRGLVLVHFACGAFQDWPEFAKLAGRVYDAKLPPHDARGPFEVKLTTVAHPVTAGLKSFQADDELYTCLGGNLPIEVLATARSKVTAQDHPMAFALNYEKGRVFHSPLGHDVKALTIPEVSELFRRAAAWTAGLAPTGAE
jgi:type 1 glutamine amidotransferase